LIPTGKEVVQKAQGNNGNNNYNNYNNGQGGFDGGQNGGGGGNGFCQVIYIYIYIYIYISGCYHFVILADIYFINVKTFSCYYVFCIYYINTGR
jgi:hypothetical protein